MITSFMTYKLGEKPLHMKKTATINKFIPFFYMMYDIFVSEITPALADRIDQSRRLVVKMTQKRLNSGMVMGGKSGRKNSLIAQI